MRTAVQSKPQPKESQKKTRIFLVDDHPIVLEGLTQLINGEEDLTVCGRAESVHKTREQIERLKPDLAIVDISLRGISGIELIKTLKMQHPKMRTLVLSMHDETIYAQRCLRAGAKGYIMKGQPVQDLLTAIRKVLKGEIYLSEKMTSALLGQLSEHPSDIRISPIARLSDRELETLELIGKGQGTKQISKTLHVSVKTVESYRERIKAKLGLENSTQLIQYATRWVEDERNAKVKT